MEKKIEEKNRRVATFMEYKTQDSTFVREIPRIDFFVTVDGENKWVREDYLKFNTSWDWLMDAVHKCLEVIDEENVENKFREQLSHFDKSITFDAVLEVIDWYIKKK